MDSDSITRRSEVAPRISEELKTWLSKRLDEGLTARQVFEEHKNVWYEGWTKNRKHSKTTLYFLSMFVIMSIKRIFFWYKHKNALVSVNMWKLENPNVIFYYQNDDATRGVPFTIGIQTSWQKIPRLCNTYRIFFCHAGFCKICTATLQYLPHFLLPH